MGERYLIDTNVIIDFFGIKLSGPVELFCSNDLTASEIKRFDKFISIAQIFDNIDAEIIKHAIEIRKDNKIKLPDAIIAATAISNDMTLISSNKKDFGKVTGLKFLDLNDI